MFENYTIALVTKTINIVSEIDEDTLEYNTTHENEGVMEIRISEKGSEPFVCRTFFEPVQDQEEVYHHVAEMIHEHETKSPFA